MAERSIWDRMKGAAMLDIPTYEEVEHDENLTTQAAMVVLIAALARGVGGWSRHCSVGWYGPESPT